MTDPTGAFAPHQKWQHLVNEAGTIIKVPDDEDAVAFHTARGWSLTDPPADGPVVPEKGELTPAADEGWITLVLPETGGTQRIPDDAGVLAEALKAGWQLPSAEGDDEGEQDSEPTENDPAPPVKSKAKPKTASAAETEKVDD